MYYVGYRLEFIGLFLISIRGTFTVGFVFFRFFVEIGVSCFEVVFFRGVIKR